jgi:hypothetical protein
VGGQYDPNSTSLALPFDAAHTNTTENAIRRRESDNVSNFHNGRLE